MFNKLKILIKKSNLIKKRLFSNFRIRYYLNSDSYHLNEIENTGNSFIRQNSLIIFDIININCFNFYQIKLFKIIKTISIELIIFT